MKNGTVYKAGQQTGEDPFEFVLSTSARDRAGDIVEQDWKLADFKRNPIALWAHRSDQPIGTWKRIRIEGGRLLGQLRLAEKGTDGLIDFLRAMIEQRILKAASVGFLPGKMEPLDEKEPWNGYRLSKNQLLEVSLVSVPANPQALSLAKAMLPPAQLRSVFSEKARDPAYFSCAEQLGFSKSSRDSGTRNNPFYEKRKRPMTLSERIQAKQEYISQKRDESVALQKQLEENEAAVDSDDVQAEQEEILAQLEEVSGQIEGTQKELDVLLRAEKAMALRAADTEKADVRKAANKGREPSMGPVQRIETQQKRPKGHRQMAIFACMLAGHVHRQNAAEIARSSYPDEPELEHIVKAAVNPADTATPDWAGNLVTETYAEFVELLRDVSIYPQVPGIRTQFDRNGRIVVPQQQGRGNLQAGFIAELKPIPVKSGVIATTDLTPKKMGVISTYSKELGRQSTPAIQQVISDQILGDTAEALDTAYMDNGARSALRPAGLQDPTETGAGNIVASTGATVAAINADSKAMIGRFLQSRSGANAVWIMNPLRVLGLRTVQDAASGAFPFAAGISAGVFQGYPFLVSQNVPEDTVFLQSNRAMTFADAFMPMLEVNDVAALVLSDDPENDYPATVGMSSLYQIDGVGVKLTLGLDWRLTRSGGSIQVLTGVAW